ncbi:MAG: ABC transporter permease [Candidatus Gastranaerophilales bacterium]|nr:ABC transporter permease [Candidatus Gastranaerophilales bacterium]
MTDTLTVKFDKNVQDSLVKSVLKDKFARVAFVILAILYLGIFLADFISPYSKDYSNRHMAYSPPSKIYIIDENGHLSLPYTYNYKREFDAQNFKVNFKPDRSKKYYVKYFAKGEPYKLFGFIPFDRHFYNVEKGGNIYLLGTDINGRDNFSRLLYGGRISLTIGFLALFVSFPLGMLYGGISGYFGGKTDFIMMRVAEAIMSIPSFYLLIILASILPANMTSVQRFTLIILILALIGWAGFSRVVRGMVLSIKKQEFVQATESLGASRLRIIIRHILPQTISYVIVAMTLSVPSYILAESGLSFLGLGIQQPDASWGNMLKEAQEFTNIISRPWLLMPGFLIFLAVLSFNLIGDTIRDVLDPKSKVR